MNSFLHEGALHFEEGFPVDSLIFLRYPNAHTRRMHVQLGTFVYPTPHSWASKVFSRLDIMGIRGSSMYMTAEGVAKDVNNDYVFNRRSAYLRGI